MVLGIGRIVHYVVPSGECRPAIVTWVWGKSGCSNMVVFRRLEDDTPPGMFKANETSWRADSVEQVEEHAPHQWHTWHWPDRCKSKLNPPVEV